MTDDQRIEAARIAYDRADPLPGNSEGRRAMKEALTAAYPELHSDKPSHWLAPWEASEEMLRAGRLTFSTVYDRMRAAHLAKDQE